MANLEEGFNLIVTQPSNAIQSLSMTRAMGVGLDTSLRQIFDKFKLSHTQSEQLLELYSGSNHFEYGLQLRQFQTLILNQTQVVININKYVETYPSLVKILIERLPQPTKFQPVIKSQIGQNHSNLNYEQIRDSIDPQLDVETVRRFYQATNIDTTAHLNSEINTTDLISQRERMIPHIRHLMSDSPSSVSTSIKLLSKPFLVSRDLILVEIQSLVDLYDQLQQDHSFDQYLQRLKVLTTTSFDRLCELKKKYDYVLNLESRLEAWTKMSDDLFSHLETNETQIDVNRQDLMPDMVVYSRQQKQMLTAMLNKLDLDRLKSQYTDAEMVFKSNMYYVNHLRQIMNTPNVCPICVIGLADHVLSTCGHVYCLACIEKISGHPIKKRQHQMPNNNHVNDHQIFDDLVNPAMVGAPHFAQVPLNPNPPNNLWSNQGCPSCRQTFSDQDVVQIYY